MERNHTTYGFGLAIPSAPNRRVLPGNAPKALPSAQEQDGLNFDAKLHPCARSLTHMSWLVYWWSAPGEVVCDPFMGSGTTGMVCAMQGRQFLGIEVDPRYFDLACTRIERAWRQRDLVVAAETPRPVQTDFIEERLGQEVAA